MTNSVYLFGSSGFSRAGNAFEIQDLTASTNNNGSYGLTGNFLYVATMFKASKKPQLKAH